MNKWPISIIALVAVISVGFVLIINDTSIPERESTAGTAPSFSYVDYEGNLIEHTDFEGKALVVNSWASWCPFCVDELPDFAELQSEFSDSVVVVAINRAESRERAKGFTDSLGVTHRLTFLLDAADSYYKRIGGFTMPETLFVGREGNIVVHKRGFMELDEMREHTQRALGI